MEAPVEVPTGPRPSKVFSVRIYKDYTLDDVKDYLDSLYCNILEYLQGGEATTEGETLVATIPINDEWNVTITDVTDKDIPTSKQDSDMVDTLSTILGVENQPDFNWKEEFPSYGDYIANIIGQASNGVIECPGCGHSMEPDCPKCVECGWENPLLKEGLI